jgi:dihydroorotate dehydrogenase (NAD+) catalytic subunit
MGGVHSPSMAGPDVSVELCGLRLENPFLLASGILGETGPSLLGVLEGGAAGVVTKSIGPEPRDGHPNPTVTELGPSMLNAMGLPNPGARAFREELEWLKGKATRPVIASVFGATPEEYAEVASHLAPLVEGVELNLSCPHAKGLGAEIGGDPELLEEVVRVVTAAVDVPVLAKLTPNTRDIAALARAAQRGGADGLTAINTLRAMAVNVEMGAPALANVYGGLSGEAVRPVGVRCVHEIASVVDLPVVGVGGVGSARDALEYIMAGATAVQLGTAVKWEGPGIFSRISKELSAWLEANGHSSIRDVQGILVGGGC